jgi:hypothetical protein
MQSYPLNSCAAEPTRKQLWCAAFTAALHRVAASEAIVEADEALRLCDERWRNAPTVGSCNYEHNYPVGHTFGFPSDTSLRNE